MAKKISIVVNLTPKEVKEIIGRLPKGIFQSLINQDMIFLGGDDLKKYMADCPDLDLILASLTLAAFRKVNNIIPDEPEEEQEDERVEKLTVNLSRDQAEVIKLLTQLFAQSNK